MIDEIVVDIENSEVLINKNSVVSLKHFSNKCKEFSNQSLPLLPPVTRYISSDFNSIIIERPASQIEIPKIGKTFNLPWMLYVLKSYPNENFYSSISIFLNYQSIQSVEDKILVPIFDSLPSFAVDTLYLNLLELDKNLDQNNLLYLLNHVLLTIFEKEYNNFQNTGIWGMTYSDIFETKVLGETINAVKTVIENEETSLNSFQDLMIFSNKLLDENKKFEITTQNFFNWVKEELDQNDLLIKF